MCQHLFALSSFSSPSIFLSFLLAQQPSFYASIPNTTSTSLQIPSSSQQSLRDEARNPPSPSPALTQQARTQPSRTPPSDKQATTLLSDHYNAISRHSTRLGLTAIQIRHGWIRGRRIPSCLAPAPTRPAPVREAGSAATKGTFTPSLDIWPILLIHSTLDVLFHLLISFPFPYGSFHSKFPLESVLSLLAYFGHLRSSSTPTELIVKSHTIISDGLYRTASLVGGGASVLG